VHLTLVKKKEVIDQMQEEMRIKDVHIAKLKDVIDKQRSELIK
jgi:hypothetical protein